MLLPVTQAPLTLLFLSVMPLAIAMEHLTIAIAPKTVRKLADEYEDLYLSIIREVLGIHCAVLTCLIIVLCYETGIHPNVIDTSKAWQSSMGMWASGILLWGLPTVHKMARSTTFEAARYHLAIANLVVASVYGAVVLTSLCPPCMDAGTPVVAILFALRHELYMGTGDP